MNRATALDRLLAEREAADQRLAEAARALGAALSEHRKARKAQQAAVQALVQARDNAARGAS